MFVGFGSVLNASLIVFGSILGLTIAKRLPKELLTSVKGGIGVFTLLLGVELINQGGAEFLKVFVCLSLGAALGWFLRRQARFEYFEKQKGAVSAFLLFSVGPMTFLGCMLEGTKGDSSILVLKSLIDGVSSIFLSASLGRGVAFSAILVLAFQLSLTYASLALGGQLSQEAVARALFVGGGLLVLSALEMLGLEIKVKPLDVLPGLLMCIIVP